MSRQTGPLWEEWRAIQATEVTVLWRVGPQNGGLILPPWSDSGVEPGAEQHGVSGVLFVSVRTRSPGLRSSIRRLVDTVWFSDRTSGEEFRKAFLYRHLGSMPSGGHASPGMRTRTPRTGRSHPQRALAPGLERRRAVTAGAGHMPPDGVW